MERLPQPLDLLWKEHHEAFRSLEAIGSRLKEMAAALRAAGGNNERFGLLDREFIHALREWDEAFARFMRTNERFRLATAQVAEEHEERVRRIRESRSAFLTGSAPDPIL